jgi:hypothetical protein
MKINVTVGESDYFHKLLILLNDIPPFSKVRPRELELYSHILQYYHAHSRMPLNEINDLVFSINFRNQLASKLDIEVSGVYNLMKGLRKAGIIEKDKLIPKFIIPKTKALTFNFVSTE